MNIVKITILLILITANYTWVVRLYTSAKPMERLKMKYEDYCPTYMAILGILVILCIIGIFVSAIWLLFFN